MGRVKKAKYLALNHDTFYYRRTLGPWMKNQQGQTRLSQYTKALKVEMELRRNQPITRSGPRLSAYEEGLEHHLDEYLVGLSYQIRIYH
jgi:hypothetical protein